MFSVKISSVEGISISKTRLEFFNLKRFRGVESKIQAGIVNARIKNVTKKSQFALFVMLSEAKHLWLTLGCPSDQIIRDSSLRSE